MKLSFALDTRFQNIWHKRTAFGLLCRSQMSFEEKNYIRSVGAAKL